MEGNKVNILLESILLGVCVGVAIVSAILIVVSEFRTVIEINNMPKVETYATVVSKRRRRRMQRKRRCYVEYKTDDGERFECRVDEKVYNRLRSGDMGIISIQGAKYLGFRKAL